MTTRSRSFFGVSRQGLAIGSLAVGFGLAGLLWAAPAQWLAPVVAGISDQIIHCRRWSGTLRHGRCEQMLSVNGELGAVAWRLDSVAFFPAALKVDLGWRRADSWLQTELAMTDFANESPTFKFFDVRGHLSFPTIRSLLPPVTRKSLGPAADAEGALWIQVSEFTLGAGSPLCAHGQMFVDTLRLPGWPSKVGPVQINLNQDCASMGGTIQDSGGPLQIALQFELEEPGMLALRGEISPRPTSAEDWRVLLALMGPMTASGGYGVDLSLEWQD